jgi:hypothetical protein
VLIDKLTLNKVTVNRGNCQAMIEKEVHIDGSDPPYVEPKLPVTVGFGNRISYALRAFTAHTTRGHQVFDTCDSVHEITLDTDHGTLTYKF